MQFGEKHMMQLFFFVDAEHWTFIILWREEFLDARIEYKIDLFSVYLFIFFFFSRNILTFQGTRS